MKPRTIKPTLRPPVEDEPIIPPPSPELEESVRGLIRHGIEHSVRAYTEQQATERARAYRCPSHGRSRAATVERVGLGWTVTGLCCERAVAAVRADLDG